MFASNKPTDTQPGNSKVGSKNSYNANPNPDRKGSFVGNSKKVKHTLVKKKTSATAPSGAFGKARDIGGGKHNFSKGAPGHQTGSK